MSRFRSNCKFMPLFLGALLSLLGSCGHTPSLQPVTVQDFTAFVEDTGYVSDAEKYGWSVVQTSVFGYKVVEDANWRLPDGSRPASLEMPVTQVSYNDAKAYCEWAGVRLPSYREYWELVKEDKRPIISDQKGPVSPAGTVNIIGNVWDITSTTKNSQVRLAGGSIFCSENTCHGTRPEREFYVDLETGNIHIGFSVMTME
ncbi:SUMF1/EgtB/PvdO family nonheme iron enzyme [Zeaxanthinibacter enoshimensis]|uniref:Sulfatase-modifying factor enzyme 1 n=1 Tax=Zeaxanthinibacter enoshimensis TaxID=392009 RepID=A0A4V3D404_9FLAO|nr:SUMF1/EgtB/PvdO family nonheme iron enzyme [Zeaxanthinibacter enoshimensis]TDQ32441.1 sulfatase-modifying factor enzyme 1 [Zeaxanthinibacter enoshimensis]